MGDLIVTDELQAAVDLYEQRRKRVFRHKPGSSGHRAALRALTEASGRLHDIEHAQGIPIGTTREHLGLAK